MKKNNALQQAFLFCFLLCSLLPASAQDTALSNPDAAFEKARQLVFAQKRAEGRLLALQLIASYPSYNDIKTFVGRTYAWDGAYDSARYYFQQVAETKAPTLDNFVAWIDAEQWADQPQRALQVTNKALLYYKDHEELLYRKAKLYAGTGKQAEAKLLAQKIVRRNSKFTPAVLLLQQLRSQLLYNGVATGFTVDAFSKYYDPMYTGFIQSSHITRFGSVIPRLNYANRFGKRAFQPEIDLYPKLFKSTYGYLNYGYSDGSLFPKHRVGAELFTSLPGSFEASMGLRHLYFGEESKVTVYTGSVGYYAGKYWLSVRPNITPDSARTSVSASVTLRRYANTPEHFFALRLGAGFSPELQNFQSASGAVQKGIYNLKSQSAGVNYQYPINRQWMINSGFDLLHQEVEFNKGEYIFNYSFSLTLKHRFK